MHMVKWGLTKHTLWYALSWYYFIDKRTLQGQTSARLHICLEIKYLTLTNQTERHSSFQDNVSYFLNWKKNKIAQ